uniref:SMARCC C-terminal domain-containing protein n=1 Tax=Salix viminalis TaxID=40686 RepID=A0A6N2KR76_SALVM
MSSSRPTEVREPLDPKMRFRKTATIEKPDSEVIKDDNSIDKLKRAAISALSAAAVKAKLLANQEEDQIRELAASLIEKQLSLMKWIV